MGAGRLGDILENGLWALLFCMLGLTIFLILVNLQKLPSIMEDLRFDSYDTILSVKFLREYGIFGNIPLFSGPYTLFGNFPLLYAMLGSLLDTLLNNPPFSVAILYWLIEIVIAILVWFVFLKNSDWKVRTLFVLVMLVDDPFGNLFPVGDRKRQQLAILLGMALFLVQNPLLEGAIAFLTLLAQPLVGVAMIILKAADSIEKKKFSNILALVIPIILAYPFYANLLHQATVPPLIPSYGYVTEQGITILQVLFMLAVSSFFICNLKKTGLVGIVTAGMALIFPILLAIFFAIKDFAPDQFMNLFLITTSQCIYGFFNVAAFGMILLVYSKKADINRITAFLLLLLCIFNIWVVSSTLYDPPLISAPYDILLNKMDSIGMSKIKTELLSPIEYSGSLHIKPFFTIFSLQGYALLHGLNITFVDEYNMPPDISKGGTNIPNAAIPQTIYNGDTAGCNKLIGELRENGVQGLVYIVYNDPTIPSTVWMDKFTDASSLHSCGINLVSNSTDGGSLIVLYDIRK